MNKKDITEYFDYKFANAAIVGDRKFKEFLPDMYQEIIEFVIQHVYKTKEEIIETVEEYAKHLETYHDNVIGKSHEDNKHMLMYDAHSRQIAIKHLLNILNNKQDEKEN